MSVSLQDALTLNSQDLSIIPLMPRSKRPNGKVLMAVYGEAKWEQFQNRIATPEEISKWFEIEPNGNIGLVCGSISGVVAIDVDGELGQQWFKENMPKPNAFQFTSSKHKFHAFYQHPGEVVHNAVRLAPEVDVRGDGGYVVFSPSTHESGAVYTLRTLGGFNGWRSLVPLEIGLLHKKEEHPKYSCLINSKSLSVEKGGRNQKLTQLCGRQYAFGATVDEVLCFAQGWNKNHCDPPLPDKEIETTVRSMAKTHQGRNPFDLSLDESISIVEKWVKKEQGVFTESDVDRNLDVKTPQQKEKRAMAINALIDGGVIEKYGNKRGVYRLKDTTARDIDFKNIVHSEVPVWLPFGLNKSVIVQPKNVIVNAGEKNSGKTGLFMNICRQNIGGPLRQRYISSEMEDAEFKWRIETFGDTIEDWSSVEKKLCSKDPQDYIIPNGINYVDFLEIYGDFWAVAEKIKKIFDALENGVAFVNIQKKQGEEFGRGGEFTLEKARLAFSMFTHAKMKNSIIGSAKITKCKNFREYNPDGMEVFYELEKGFYFNPGRINDISSQYLGLRYFVGKEREELINKIDEYKAKLNNSIQHSIQGIDFYEGCN